MKKERLSELVRMTKTTKARIDKFRRFRRETYDEIIERILDMVEKKKK